ncbi:MAG: S-layer homology domain-containing protein [Oscillospiraceae bacterium]
MKIKRLISFLLTLVLLGSPVPALAADAGSRQDPLLSRSYVDSWSSAVLSHAEATARSAAQAALDKALQTHDNALHSAAARSRICTIYAGSTVALKTGDCFTVLSGDAGVTISAGALVDVTDGAEAVSGMLHTAHRYIACEDLQATITCTQTVSLLLSAGASVTRFVDVPADAWYADYVEYAAANGLMSGVGHRRFAPDDVLTRAMFVTVLGQLAQIDEADYPAVSFSDVVPGAGMRRLSRGPRRRTSSAAPETALRSGRADHTRTDGFHHRPLCAEHRKNAPNDRRSCYVQGHGRGLRLGA